MKVSSRLALTTLLGMAALAPSASATVITELTFDSLPSAQGWRFERLADDAAVPESTAFSVTGTALLQTTMGLSYNNVNASGQIGYVYDLDASWSSATTISLFFTTAVTAQEEASHPNNYASHMLGVAHNGQEAYIGIKPGSLYMQGSNITPGSGFDGSVANSYQLTLDTLESTYSLFLNGSLLISGSSASSTAASSFYILDGTGTANANATVTQFIAVEGHAIPEPSAFILVGGALTLAAAARYRRKA